MSTNNAAQRGQKLVEIPKKNRQATSKQLNVERSKYNLNVCDTVCNLLNVAGFKFCNVKTIFQLVKKRRKARLQLCNNQVNWSFDKCNKAIFKEESRKSLGIGDDCRTFVGRKLIKNSVLSVSIRRVNFHLHLQSGYRPLNTRPDL